MQILNRIQRKLIIVPLNVISFATAEFHVHSIMTNTNKVQIKQNAFFGKYCVCVCIVI